VGTPTAVGLDAGTSLRDIDAGKTSFAVFKPLYPAEPLRITQERGSDSLLAGNLTQVAREGMVLNAVDLRLGTFAMTAFGETPHSTRYEQTTEYVARAMLPDWLRRAGEAGQVVTAISGGGERMFVAAYTRGGDARRYEMTVLEASYGDLVERAQSLADEGYVITAFGRDSSSLLLVGTRVIGDWMKREILAMQFEDAREKLVNEAGFAVVAWIRPRSTPEGGRGVVILER
jgi:hypothetical protein